MICSYNIKFCILGGVNPIYYNVKRKHIVPDQRLAPKGIVGCAQ